VEVGAPRRLVGQYLLNPYFGEESLLFVVIKSMLSMKKSFCEVSERKGGGK